MNTDTLSSNYDDLIVYASSTSFGAPPDGEWDAEQVVAHLTTNDDLLLEVTLAVLAGRDASYDNAAAIDTSKLDALVDECGGMSGLVERLRSTSTRIVDAVQRLDDDSSARLLPVRIVDGTTVVVDQPLPIAALYQAQANIHIPNHLQQLKDLAG